MNGSHRRRSVARSSSTIVAGSTRAVFLLGLGAAAGVALAVGSILSMPERAGERLPEGVVASVNGAMVDADRLERAVAGLAGDKRNPIDAVDRREVLDRLIDEELLVQRGVELGLLRHDHRVRSDLTSAVITGVVSEAEDAEPSREELRAFFSENRGFFLTPGRVRIRQVFVRVAGEADAVEAADRARLAATRLRSGEAFTQVRDELGDREIVAIPDAPLPPGKIQQYLGPTVTRTVLELEPGQVSDPIRSGPGIHVLEVLDREAAATPTFEQAEPLVRNEYRRRSGERALREYLDRLRGAAEIVVRDEGS